VRNKAKTDNLSMPYVCWRRNMIGYDPDIKFKCSHCRAAKAKEMIPPYRQSAPSRSVGKREWTFARSNYPQAKYYAIIDRLLNNSGFIWRDWLLILYNKRIVKKFGKIREKLRAT
jgi:hypothetical protein